MEKTYLFYDVETTGRNKCFDQVLQFAAIRTDLKLHELERFEIQIKLNADVIPDPEALLVHRIPLSTMKTGDNEVDAMLKIHALFNTPNTMSCGYNNLGFDDEFLRFSFYRNLLPPYTHQYANSCSRIDIYPITLIYYLYKNQTIRWPSIDGKISLKLEHISAENHLTEGRAHTAIADVEATVALARLFHHEHAMWNYLHGYFDKQTDVSRMEKLATAFENNGEVHRLGLMIGEIGAQACYQFPVLSLGQHHHYKNQSLWLRLDYNDLSSVTPCSIAEATWVVRKKAGEPGLLLPFTERYTQKLNAERLKLMQENMDFLQRNPSFFAEIKNYHQEYTYPKTPLVDPQAALYENGFLNPMEQKLCETFHKAGVEKKVQIVAQFTNPILKELAIRIIGKHYPEHMPETFQQSFANHLKKTQGNDDLNIPVDYRGEKMLTVKNATKKIHQLFESKALSEEERELLNGLLQYLHFSFEKNTTENNPL